MSTPNDNVAPVRTGHTSVWRCAGGCDTLVSSPNALCLHCAARESA